MKKSDDCQGTDVKLSLHSSPQGGATGGQQSPSSAGEGATGGCSPLELDCNLRDRQSTIELLPKPSTLSPDFHGALDDLPHFTDQQRRQFFRRLTNDRQMQQSISSSLPDSRCSSIIRIALALERPNNIAEVLRLILRTDVQMVVSQHLQQTPPTCDVPLQQQPSFPLSGQLSDQPSVDPAGSQYVPAAPSTPSSPGDQSSSIGEGDVAQGISRELKIEDMDFSLKIKLAMKLNPDREDGKDWRGLASRMKLSELLRQNIAKKKENHALVLFEHWQVNCDANSTHPADNATAGNLHRLLIELQRGDVASLLNFQD